MAPRGLQEGPHGGSKRDLGTNLAQRALPEAPGTLPDPSGERFRDQFGPKSGPQEAKIVDKIYVFLLDPGRNSEPTALPKLLNWNES